MWFKNLLAITVFVLANCMHYATRYVAINLAFNIVDYVSDLTFVGLTGYLFKFLMQMA